MSRFNGFTVPTRVAVVFGTRPEAIKLFTVVQALRSRPEHFAVSTIATGQHGSTLDTICNDIGLQVDYHLTPRVGEVSLAVKLGRLTEALGSCCEALLPEVVIVQGDTLSALAGGLAAHFCGIPVAHVEAGLRSSSPPMPFPEEISRRIIGRVGSLHFAPSERAKAALVTEGVPANTIITTGNTVVDALLALPDCSSAVLQLLKVPTGKRLILVTLHRRFAWTGLIESVCTIVKQTVRDFPDVYVVWPAHPNPSISTRVRSALGAIQRVCVTTPLRYTDFLSLLRVASLVITDSGGIQEEAATLGRPTVVLRDETERPEVLGRVVRMIGTNPIDLEDALVKELSQHHQPDPDQQLAASIGDGFATRRITASLSRWIQGVQPLLTPEEEFRPAETTLALDAD